MFRENNSIYSEHIGFKTNDSILIIIREKSDSLLNYVNSTSSLTKIEKIVIDAKNDSFYLNPICNFHVLKELDLHLLSNLEIPTCINKLMIENLDLYLCRFEKIDTTTFNWKYLKQLYINSYTLKEFTVPENNQIQEFYFFSSKIKEFKFLQKLKQLKILSFVDMGIKTIPTELIGINKLEEVNLGFNCIKICDSVEIKKLPNALKVVNLMNNRIREIDPEIFRCLPNLEKINLIGNPLSRKSLKLINEYKGKLVFVTETPRTYRFIE